MRQRQGDGQRCHFRSGLDPLSFKPSKFAIVTPSGILL